MLKLNKGIVIGILIILVIIMFSGCEEKGSKSTGQLSIEEPISTTSGNIGMVVSFPGEINEWTIGSIEETYETVKNAGIKISHLYYAWGEIEKESGIYTWNDIDFSFQAADEQEMNLSIEIKIIDVNHVGELPDDVVFTSFDDPMLKERFKAFVLKFLGRYGDKIEYIWIGNEIDEYLYQHREQLDAYFSLYNEMYLVIKEEYPDIKVGTVSTYHDAKKNNALDIIEKLGKTGDIIGFSLYPQMMKDAKVSDTETFFDDMWIIADRVDKKFAIVETSWSSDALEGSEDVQAQYIKELFGTYSKYKDKMEFLGLFILYDFAESVSREIASSYGVENRGFIRWQETLGLAYNNGTPKEAWSVFLEEMKKLGE